MSEQNTNPNASKLPEFTFGEVNQAFQDGFSHVDCPADAVNDDRFPDYLASVMQDAAPRLAAQPSRGAGDKVPVGRHTMQSDVNSAYVVRDHIIRQPQGQLGHLEAGARGAMQAIVIRSGSGTFRAIRGKHAEEFPIGPGSVVFLEGGNNYKLRPWFGIKSSETLETTVIESVTIRDRRLSDQHDLIGAGAKARRYHDEAYQQKADEQQARLERMLDPRRKRFAGALGKLPLRGK